MQRIHYKTVPAHNGSLLKRCAIQQSVITSQLHNAKVKVYFFNTVSFILMGTVKHTCSGMLKVPKCEIFDRSDFHDFYTIKPFWVVDFGAKI
jgi:hypothetical protein